MVSTRLSQLPDWGRWSLLVVLAVGLATLLWISLQPAAVVKHAPTSKGDQYTYEQIVERLRAGEDYYEAMHTELVAGNYGTRSVFNWRPPLYFSALARLPSVLWAQVIIGLIAVVALVMVWRETRATGGPVIAMAGVAFLLLGLLGRLTPAAMLFSEIAAGVLILLSVAAYEARRPVLWAVAAVLALFCRELAAPYLLICVGYAIYERRWPALAVMVGGLVAFGAYYLWHAGHVAAMITAADRAYPDGWVQFGGAAFVLATAAFNGVFAVLPLWVTALLLPFALLGLLARPDKALAGVTVGVYLVTFAVIGKPFNIYWGALYTPLLALGLPWAVPALASLVRRRS